MKSATILTKEGEKRLAILWTMGGLATFVLLVLQSLLGKYQDKAEDAWAWFLPTLVPTLSLMYGALVSDAKASKAGEKLVKRFLFRLAFGLSVLYLLLVVMIPLIQPFTGTETSVLMRNSNLWLGPLQGLVMAVLGVFFVNGKESTDPK